MITKSLQECLAFGKQIKDCEYVSWHTTNQFCKAYAGCQNFDETNTLTLTSSVNCELCHFEGKCQGFFVGESSTADEDECLKLCKEEKQCTWMSYFGDLKYCLLLEDCTSLGKT